MYVYLKGLTLLIMVSGDNVRCGFNYHCCDTKDGARCFDPVSNSITRPQTLT